MVSRSFIASVSLLLLTACAGQLGQDASPANMAEKAVQDAGTEKPPIVEPTIGPYQVDVYEAPQLPDFTIIAPRPMAGGRASFAPLAWGNGGCSTSNAHSREFLKTVASHGFLVIAPGGLDAPTDGVTYSSVQARALDWAERENSRDGSRLRGRIETGNGAVAGWSCGGLQALDNARDPRVRTVMLFNSGAFADPPPNMGERASIRKDEVALIRVPMLYVIGGPGDIAYPNAASDFELITDTPVFYANADTGHGGTFSHPGGGRNAGVAADWLKWTLYGDEAAGARFSGQDCGLCTDPVWTVKRKNM